MKFKWIKNKKYQIWFNLKQGQLVHKCWAITNLERERDRQRYRQAGNFYENQTKKKLDRKTDWQKNIKNVISV